MHRVLVSMLIILGCCLVEAEWTAVEPLPHPQVILDMDVLPSGRVWGVGLHGAISEWDGSAWKLHASPTRHSLRGLHFWDEDSGMAVGDDGAYQNPEGIVLRWNGTTWERVRSQQNFEPTDLWGPSPEHYFVCGQEGKIYRHRDGSWESMVTEVTANFEEIWGTDAANVYAVGNIDSYNGPGLILRFDGSAWVPVHNEVSGKLYGIWGFGPDDVYAVGYRSSSALILHWDGAA